MRRVGLMAGLVLLCLAANPAASAERVVPVGPGALLDAIAAARPGDVLRLAPGTHQGPLRIAVPLTLDGGGQARVVGNGSGSVIEIAAADVTVRGLTVTGSGLSLETLDSGVKLGKAAIRARVEDNRILDNLNGVDIHGARGARVAGNVIEGRRDLRVNERGNGIYVWNAPDLVVAGNTVRYGRDGIFVNTSRDDVFTGNRFEHVRFAVHYMYANDSEVSDNVSIGNDLGYALMFSRGLKVLRNVSIGDRGHGIMLNYANDALVEGNLVRDGGEKCLFMYNANRNLVRGNRFEGCPIGIHFTAGSERNGFSGNAFIANRTQVKYVGSRWHEWSEGGRGNFWSDHAAFDVNGDGVADMPYRPNDLVDRILWTQPSAGLLLGSPAIQLLRWSQSQFPALLPGGVVDSHPLVGPGPPLASFKGEGS